MLEDIFKRTEELTVELVQIRSVNKAPGEETRLAEFIFDYYKDLPYFKERPQQLIMQKHSMASFRGITQLPMLKARRKGKPANGHSHGTL